MQVYLDNAATTPLDPEVISEMTGFMKDFYGNPSSTHSKGRQARVELEKARKKIGLLIGAKEKEIIFTSGGTEANNAVLTSLALNKKVKRIISSPIEHHSILDSLTWIEAKTDTEICFLNVDSNGRLDIDQLEDLLTQDIPTLVTLMHANNEIGNLLDLDLIGNLCEKHHALFHSDMVQTMGHYPIILQDLPIDFATASAHKIHGPKGVGFLYVNSKSAKLHAFMHGGAQERGMRGGTENNIGIAGMAKAFEVALGTQEKDQKYILLLKKRMKNGLAHNIPGLLFNGDSENLETSLFNLLNIRIPHVKDETLLLRLDMEGIMLSEGSACSSGASKGSHVLTALNKGDNLSTNLRISFSKLNTVEEIDYAIELISKTVNS